MEEIFNKLSIKDNVEPEVSNKLSIKDNVEPEVFNKTTYQCFGESIEIYESNQHYTNLMCMKDTKSGPKHDEKSNKYIENINKMSGRENLKYKCVLPLGHTGECCHKFGSLFKKNDITKKLVSSIDLAIYSTPGNDEYVYKNRSSRLYENAISTQEGKKIRDKKVKKNCAIPLKDASSPILLAQAYLDWLTFIVNIEDISIHLNLEEEEEGPNINILEMIRKNKEYLVSVFTNLDRAIFDSSSGDSICVITRNIIKLSDMSDPTRDNRVNISNNDIQLGHNHPRSDDCVSIRGENLLPMSRRGNLIIGEERFTQDIWINELTQIIRPYN